MARSRTVVHPHQRCPVPPAAGADVSYLLFHSGEDPEAFPEHARRHAGSARCGPGWSVLASHGDRWSWSIRLDAHGAAFGAPPQVAQAVAVRVLAGHAIAIAGWDPGGPDSRAHVAVTTERIRPARRGRARWWR